MLKGQPNTIGPPWFHHVHLYNTCDPIAGLVADMNLMASKLEDLSDQNRIMRSQAGISDAEEIDLTDIKLTKVGSLSAS